MRVIYELDTARGEYKMELLRDLAFNEINNSDLAMQYADELISLARKLGSNRYLYRGYLHKGNSQINQGNLAVALDAYQNALNAAKADGYTLGEASALMYFAIAYVIAGEPDRAGEFFEKSIEIFKDPKSLAEPSGKVSLGTILYNAGEFYMDLGELEKAQGLLEEAGEIFEEIGDRLRQSFVLGTQGIIYAKSGDFRKAEANVIQAIEELEVTQNYAAIADFQTSLAQVYRDMEEYDRAHAWATRAVEHALRLGLKEQISQSSLVLAELDSVQGNFREAYAHLNVHMQYKDSMDVASIDMTRLEREKAELETLRANNELELRSLQQKRERAALWAIGVTALLLFVLFFGSYRRYKYTKRTNQIISEERDRSESLLLNILPKQTAQELKKMGKVKAQRFESVTVLFTDFRNFTTYAEVMDPEHLVQSIDYYFSYFDSLMDKYGLEKIKTVGDAYMCAGGLPYPTEDHALRVVAAAREILEFVEANKGREDQGQVRFDIRIGINSGPVVAGVVGTKKFAYDIWGDTVNIASRMESASEVGRINVAEGTYRLIKDTYECEYRGSIAVKNRGELDMYYVNGVKPGRQPVMHPDQVTQESGSGE
ncbi:adenylate/guanylate cyclase domain-containing protein [Robiginitalea sp. SC105]|uniref:adenylate/guanylate cyclase domain-containing protein n=1 Tax=Robiginitalea sp. SC105 TaxID=2762332 RepID=UPI00163AEE7E|nr:adenylate/guanylate cyclase domain-containing protein [Robiginitalea sp. SC105]MBC2840416.1 tetratricopeptide repeat protein [Robiginitalea sp. SC105]